jgi:VanZ family protein
MISTIFRIGAWLSLACIAIATVAPIEYRPISGYPVNLERFIAFAAMGAVCAIAYPRHFILIALVVAGTALLLEVLQLFSPSRHGRAFDAAVKICGGAIGLGFGRLVLLLFRRLKIET